MRPAELLSYIQYLFLEDWNPLEPRQVSRVTCHTCEHLLLERDNRYDNVGILGCDIKQAFVNQGRHKIHECYFHVRKPK